MRFSSIDEMETIDYSFTRLHRSGQENYLFKNVPQLNAMAHAADGLKPLHDCTQYGGVHSSLANTLTDSAGRFVPVQHMVLVNRYRILSCIETNGQSAVLVKAEDYFNDMVTVVLKVMHTSYLEVGLKEVQTLKKMNSMDPKKISHTIHLLNSFRFKDHICLVFPLLSSLPLTDVIAKKFLYEDEILSAIRKISIQLLSVLVFLKSLNIIHADIKPDNILLERDDDITTVTLIDFGNAIHHTHSEVSLYYTDFELQTQPYRAPEVHLGHPFSMEVDMWSLGCVLLELLTGQIIFSGNNRADSLKKMVSVLGPLPANMCRRGKFYHEVESVVAMTQSTHKVGSGALRLMSAFPSIKDYEFFSFLSGILTYCPDKRMTPWEALHHPFIAPTLCIPRFLTGTDFDSDMIRKPDHNFKQHTSTNAHQLYPSTYDQLHSETSHQILLGRSNLAFVEPQGHAFSIGKEDSLQHEYERNYCIMQGSGNSCVSSFGRRDSFSSDVYRARRYASPVINELEMFPPVKYRPAEQIKCNPALSNESYNRIPAWGNTRLPHRFKEGPNTSVFNQVTESFKGCKSSRKGGNNRSFDLSSAQDKFSILPRQDNPMHSSTKYHSQRGEKYLSGRDSCHTDQANSFSTKNVVNKCDRPIRKQRCSYLQNCYRQDGALVYKNHSLIKTGEEISGIKNLVSISSGRLSPSGRKTVVAEEANLKPKCLQNQSLCLEKTTLCRPCEDTSTENVDVRYSEKIDLDENGNSYKNSYQKQDQTRTCFQEAKIAIVQSLNQDEVLLHIDDKNAKVNRASFSLLNLSKDYPDVNNKVKIYLPFGRELSEVVDNCSHIPSSGDHGRVVDLIKDVQQSPNIVHSDISVNNMTCMLNISPISNETSKSSLVNVCYKQSFPTVSLSPITFSQKSLPAIVSQKTLPSTDNQKSSPAIVSQKSLPSIVDQKSLPATVNQNSLPAIVSQKFLPATVNQMGLAAIVSQKSLLATAIVNQMSLPATAIVNQMSLPATAIVNQMSLPATAVVNQMSFPATAVVNQMSFPATAVVNQMSFPATAVVNQLSIPATACQKSSSIFVLTDFKIENHARKQEEEPQLSFIFRNDAEMLIVQRRELKVDVCNILRSCTHRCKDFNEAIKFINPNTGGSTLETKMENIAGKSEAHELGTKLGPRNLEINYIEKHQDCQGKTHFQSEIYQTPSVRRIRAASSKLVSYTKQRLSLLYADKFSYDEMSKICRSNHLCPKLLSLKREGKKASKHGQAKKKNIKCWNESSLRTNCFKTSNLINDLRKCEAEKEIECCKQTFKKAALLKMGRLEKMKAHTFKYITGSVDYRIKLRSIKNEINRKNINVKLKFRATKKDKCNHKYKKKPETLHRSMSKKQITEEGTNKIEVSDPLVDINAMLNPSQAQRDSDFILNEDFKLQGRTCSECVLVKPEPQGIQQRNVSDKVVNARRLLRTKSVKRALSFHINKSQELYGKRKCVTAKVQRSVQSSKLPTHKSQTKTYLACCDKTKGGDLPLSNLMSSGAIRKASHQFRHLLSTSAHHQNSSSDPYEFVASPAKPKPTMHYNKFGKIRIARHKRSKACATASNIKNKNNNCVVGMSSEVFSTPSITIRELVEKKSRHMFQNMSSSLDQDSMRPFNILACKSLPTNEEKITSKECRILMQNRLPAMIWEPKLPATKQEKPLSRHGSIKTSASREQQSGEIFYASILMSPGDESKLASAATLPSTQNTWLKAAHYRTNDTVKNSDEIGGCVNEDITLDHSCLEKTISRKIKCGGSNQNEAFEEQLKQIFHHVGPHDSESTSRHVSTFDCVHLPSLKLSSAGCVDNESYFDEEVLLLD